MSKRPIAIAGAAVGAAFILVLYVLIVRAVLGQRSERTELEDDVFMMERALEGQQDGAQLLSTTEAELEALQATLEAAEFAFPSEMDSTDVLDYVITAAVEQGVALGQVEARDPVTATIGGGAYRVFAYDVEVEGELESLVAFLAALEAGGIETLTLDQIRMEAQSTPEMYRATLVIQVYFRP